MKLLIIDPQIDFITGTLAVPGAEAAMQYLASWIRQHEQEIEEIILSADQHPPRHCSFREQGGPWPAHCVRYTLGAAIYPELAEALLQFVRNTGKDLEVWEKATTLEADAYSAFEAEVPDSLRMAKQIVVAGLAGDYCVRQTLLDLSRHGLSDRLFILPEAIASIDGGGALAELSIPILRLR